MSADTARREPERLRGLATVVDEMERLLVETELRARRLTATATRRSNELENISEAQSSDGDLSAEEERALAELAIVASVVLGPEAGVIVEAVGHLLDWLFG